MAIGCVGRGLCYERGAPVSCCCPERVLYFSHPSSLTGYVSKVCLTDSFYYAVYWEFFDREFCSVRSRQPRYRFLLTL